MFEKASRLKLRFSTNQGELAADDLWDLSLQSIDLIARNVNKQLRNEEEESFLSSTSRKAPTHNDLRLDILKRIIAVKEEEQKARKDRAETMAKIARLKELAAHKADEELSSKSREEIEKEIQELELAFA